MPCKITLCKIKQQINPLSACSFPITCIHHYQTYYTELTDHRFSLQDDISMVQDFLLSFAVFFPQCQEQQLEHRLPVLHNTFIPWCLQEIDSRIPMGTKICRCSKSLKHKMVQYLLIICSHRLKILSRLLILTTNNRI